MEERDTFETLDMALTAADASLSIVARVWESMTPEERDAWLDSRDGRLPDVRTFLVRLLPDAIP